MSHIHKDVAFFWKQIDSNLSGKAVPALFQNFSFKKMKRFFPAIGTMRESFSHFWRLLGHKLSMYFVVT